jgi:hypothetical protein
MKVAVIISLLQGKICDSKLKQNKDIFFQIYSITLSKCSSEAWLYRSRSSTLIKFSRTGNMKLPYFPTLKYK